jgi:hypothetical protein
MLVNRPSPSGTPTDTGAVDVDGAAELFRKRAEDARTKGPSKEPKEEAHEDEIDQDDDEEGLEDPEGSTEETEEDTTEEAPEEKPAKRVASDDDEVVFTVDGKEQRASIKDLKRLAGQEAALTRKSQEVAALRQHADTEAKAVKARLDKLLENANKRRDQYKDLDFFVLAKDPAFSAEDLKVLRREQEAAEADVKFLTEELKEVQEQDAAKEQEAWQSKAKETFAILGNKEHPLSIPDWSLPTYQKMLGFGASAGLDPVELQRINDARELKILHMAMSWAEAQSKVKKLKPATSVTPKKVAKPGSSSASPDEASGDAKGALARLRQSGDVEDAAAAFKALTRARRAQA